ncbi:hypothetical protein V5O48_006610 [Marasmius crinis-equi]|uniref:FAD/NAD(P)-binding domain-containing protein n=1 Tax=Marasmius crinis-equi TaxID=585013 RepID=A0ABR3FJ13_9AGAR
MPASSPGDDYGSCLVAVIGAGAAGLITAHTLIQDGFDVRIITRDTTVGGVWSGERVYPGLNLNNVHGEYHFSALPMKVASGTWLNGEDMKQYMQNFATKYLLGHVRFQTEVLKIYREATSWVVQVHNLNNGSHERLVFDKIVLCSGCQGCSAPKIPRLLAPARALELGFKGLIFHSSEFGNRIPEILDRTPENAGHIIIVGGGKSAQDTAAYLANAGRKVTVVFETTDAFIASKIPLPDFIRRSRHYDAMSIPKDSPLRFSHPLFWTIRVGDPGLPRENSFYSLVNNHKVNVVAPVRVTGYGTGPSDDTITLQLNNGTVLVATAVILATGFTSSWSNLFDDQTAKDIGICRHPPNANDFNEPEEEWPWRSLVNPPSSRCDSDLWSSSIYQGIVPAKNILKRDFAINGAVFNTHNGYVYEVTSHWISSYFLGDKMDLPPSPEVARREASREARFLRKRYPSILLWVNESYSAGLKFWTWPQYTDELLKEMGLQSGRSGGNWLTWPFKVIDMSQLATLREERRERRARLGKSV